MSFSDLLGYFLAVFVGISLGLFGSGGSILSVPILVYVFNVPPSLATAYSLFIIGNTATVGSFQKILQKLVDFNKVLLVGIPSIITVFVTRKFIVPSIPNIIFLRGDFVVQKSILIMVIFSIVMMIAALKMIYPSKKEVLQNGNKNWIKTLFLGISIGFIAGFTGAGGGFLIVPILIYFAKTPMDKAVGTSLFIIAVQSLIGFTGDLHNQIYLDWKLLLSFSFCATVGIFAGNIIAKKTNARRLKTSFGWFVLIVGIYTFAREVF